MTFRGVVAGIAVAATLPIAAAGQYAVSFGGDIHAQNTFLAARAAISRHGGSIVKLRSLFAAGRARFITADGSATEGRIEFRVLLPDRFLRIDQSGTARRRFGISAGRLVHQVSEGAHALQIPPAAENALLERAHRDFVLFMTGMVLYPPDSESILFRSMIVGATANEPYMLNGAGDTVRFTLSLDPRTRMPSAIGYAEEGVDVTLAFDDRRTVSGLELPHHVIRTAGALRTDDFHFEELRVNPPLTKDDFLQ